MHITVENAHLHRQSQVLFYYVVAISVLVGSAGGGTDGTDGTDVIGVDTGVGDSSTLIGANLVVTSAVDAPIAASATFIGAAGSVDEEGGGRVILAIVAAPEDPADPEEPGGPDIVDEVLVPITVVALELNKVANEGLGADVM
jgi:hypothetical protein